MRVILATAFASLFAAAPARVQAQVAASANDGKTVLVDGVTAVSRTPVPDTVTVLDLSVWPPRVAGTVRAPASVVGPRRASRSRRIDRSRS